MFGTYLPLIVLPAAALVFSLRRPAVVDKGKAPLGARLSQDALALGLLVACGWFVLVIASQIREWGCPGGFDHAGKCIEKGADLGPFGIILLATPLALAVAYALGPVRLE